MDVLHGPDRHRFGGALVLSAVVMVLASCAPIESVRLQDKSLRMETVAGPGHNARAELTARTDQDGGVLVIRSHETCTERVEEVFQRTQIKERHTDTMSSVLLYGFGGVGVVLGGIVVADAHKVPDANDPTTMNPISRTGAYAIGGGLLAIGGALVATAVGSSMRARDEQSDLGTVRVATGAPGKDVDCHAKPLAQAAIALAPPSSPGRLSLGKTSADGEIKFTWAALEKLFSETKPPAAAEIEVPGFGTVGQLDLDKGRTFWAERTRAEAKRLAVADQVDEAKAEMARAERLGADVGEVRAALAAAPTTIARQREAEEKERARQAARKKEADEHLVRARALVRKNDPDGASAELDAADGLGADTNELRDAVAKTPAARARERELERAQKEIARRDAEADKRRAADERSGGATRPACAHASGNGGSAQALSVFLNGTLDPLQQAEIYSAAMRIVGRDSYPLSRGLTSLEPSVYAMAARGKLSDQDYHLLVAVGAQGDKDAVLRLIFSYRDQLFLQMIHRTLSLRGWGQPESASEFREQLLSSPERLRSFAYALAVQYGMSASDVLRGFSLVYCGKEHLSDEPSGGHGSRSTSNRRGAP